MRNNKPVLLLYIGICLNLVLFCLTYHFKLPLLPYHTGTLYVSALLGPGAGILTTMITFLTISLFCYGKEFIWFTLSGVIISFIVGEQFKKETRITNWLVTAGEVLLLDLFFYILITLWQHNSIPYDYAGQRIFMYFYTKETNEIIAVCLAGIPIILLSVVQQVLTAFLGILCTPKHWLTTLEETASLKQNRLKSQKHKDGTA